MPRITKKMKEEELLEKENKLTYILLLSMNLSVNQDMNVIDNDSGKRLVYNGKTNMGKFVKYGEGPFTRKEIKFDPLNNYQFINFLFSVFIERVVKENAQAREEYKMMGMQDPENRITYIRTMCLKDGQEIQTPKDIVVKKYLELDTDVGKVLSDEFIHPALAYADIIVCMAGHGPTFGGEYLRRVDELKFELQQTTTTGSRRSY